MSGYVTTNIRLLEEDYLRLKAEAARKRTSLSSVIREKISRKEPSEGYAEKLLSIGGSWFSPEEVEKNRAEVEKRVKKHPS